MINYPHALNVNYNKMNTTRIVYLLILGICILIGCIKFKQLEKPYFYLWLLIIITFINEIIITILQKKGLNYNVQLHFFPLIEFYFYAKIYQEIFDNEKVAKKVNLLLGLLFALQIINTTLLQPIYESNTNIFMIESIFLIFLSLLYFNDMAKKMNYGNLFKLEAFWFNSFVFIFYAYNINIWGFDSLKVAKWVIVPNFIYQIMAILCILMYLVFGLILLKNKKTDLQ